jgi:hypothetical protein
LITKWWKPERYDLLNSASTIGFDVSVVVEKGVDVNNFKIEMKYI